MTDTLTPQNFNLGLEYIFRVEKRFKPFQKILKDVSFEVKPLTFWSIARVIIGQQLSGAAANTIANRVLVLDESIRTPKTFRSINPETLKSCGLSKQKIKFLVGIAIMLDENLNYFEGLKDLSGAEMQKEFVKINGIGPWSATILTIFYGAKPDVLVTGDVTINKVIQYLFRTEIDQKSKILLELLEHWRPYRSVGCILCYELFDRKMLPI